MTVKRVAKALLLRLSDEDRDRVTLLALVDRVCFTEAVRLAIRARFLERCGRDKKITTS